MSKDFVPARLLSEEVAARLGFKTEDIRELVSRRMLKPLGKPVANATKHFAACDIEKLATDREWLNKATQAMYDYWAEKNSKKSDRQAKNIVPLAVPMGANPPQEQTALSE